MTFTFRPMDEVGARAILSWRYDEPYTLYNRDPDEVEAGVQAFLTPTMPLRIRAAISWRTAASVQMHKCPEVTIVPARSTLAWACVRI